MSLTKVEEPSDYTKKEAAKLRIEELTRDLGYTEKEIRSMVETAHSKRKIEDLISDNLINKTKDTINRFNELKNKYISIKDLIEKEQKTYDTHTKKETLTQEQLVKKVANEFEDKVSKVVSDSKESKKVMDGILDELTPKDELSSQIQHLNISIIDFQALLLRQTDLKNIKEELGETKEDVSDKLQILSDESSEEQEKEIRNKYL